MSRIKVAFAAQMRAGKDTAAEFIMKKFGARNIKFADPIYDILAYAQQRCGIPQRKDRLFLQFIGTDWARNTINQNIWVDTLLTSVNQEAGNIVVSDARFKNEFEVLKEAGFMVVKIERDESLRMAHESGPADELHASELDVKTYVGFDAIVQNNGTIAEFEAQICKLVVDRFGLNCLS